MEYSNKMKIRYFVFLLVVLVAWGAEAQTAKRSAQSRTQGQQRKTAVQSQRKTTAQNRRKQQTKTPVYRDVTYVVNGTASGYADGEWVRLCVPAVGGLQAHDSVRVEGGKFRFTGKTKNVPYMQYLTIGEGMNKNITELLLEEGTINVELVAGEKKDRVTGTTHNDIYTPYRDSLNDIYTKIFACMTEASKLSNSQEDRESYNAGADMLRKKIVTVTYDYASKNMTNWVGVYLFAQYYKRFSPEQNKALLAKMARKYGNLPITAQIRKYVNNQK